MGHSGRGRCCTLRGRWCIYYGIAASILITLIGAYLPAVLLLPEGYVAQHGTVTVGARKIGILWTRALGIDRVTVGPISADVENAWWYAFCRLPELSDATPLSSIGASHYGEKIRYIVATGLPFRSLACFAFEESPGQFRWRGGIPIPDASVGGQVESRCLPLLPLWAGMLGDLLLWAAVAVGTGAGWIRLRMWRRARRGQCRYCGYPRAGLQSPVCPECGHRHMQRTPRA
jgi:hypothetical protein